MANCLYQNLSALNINDIKACIYATPVQIVTHEMNIHEGCI